MRVLLRLVWLVLVVALSSVCTGSGSTVNGPTPGNEPGPAFEMAVLGEVACPSEATATTCVEARIANLGNTGDGTCTLWADFTTSNGGDSMVGPRITLSDMASGATITKTLAWKDELPADPDLFFRGLCDPGLRS